MRYTLVDLVDGTEFSGSPLDYPKMSDEHVFGGLMLVRREHPFITNTGRIVYARRLLKTEPTLRDLRRLALPF